MGLQGLAHEASVALQQALSPLRIFTAVLGRTTPLPNSYPHLHVHVVPVYECDERARPARVLSWSEGVVVYDDVEAAALTAELRACWPSADRVDAPTALAHAGGPSAVTD
jgi:diadenosine tetraphosphate (Ap4A) HIT family hydrolase